MENTIEQVVTTNQIITQESLEAIPYGDLKTKFKELGVPSAWRAGKKKEDLIQDALQKLNEIKDDQKQDLTNEQLVDDLDVDVEQIKASHQDEENVPEDPSGTLEEGSAQSSENINEEQKPVLTVEVIEKNLKLIQANLNNGLESQRPILLKKKEALLELLKRAES